MVDELKAEEAGCQSENKRILFADRLLSRTADQGYLTEWTSLLAKPVEVPEGISEYPAVIFRLGSEWFGLSAFVFSEVTDLRKVHEIPHRRSKFLMGVVNLNGQLRMCVDLQGILEVPDRKAVIKKPELGATYSRMIAIFKDLDFWLFPVDEVFGIHHLKLDQLENVPVTVSKSTSNFLKGVFNWHDNYVGLIDDELLLSNLKRSIL